MAEKFCREVKNSVPRSLTMEQKEKLFDLTLRELAKTLNEGTIQCTYQYDSGKNTKTLNCIKLVKGVDVTGNTSEYGNNILEMIATLIEWVTDYNELDMILRMVKNQMRILEEDDECFDNCCECNDADCEEDEDDDYAIQREVLGLPISDDELVELHYIKKVPRSDDCEDDCEGED